MESRFFQAWYVAVEDVHMTVVVSLEIPGSTLSFRGWRIRVYDPSEVIGLAFGEDGTK